MKNLLLSVTDMQKTDQAQINSGTASLELMENAGQQVTDYIVKNYDKGHVLIACGPGNNGGDGFVIARLLAKQGWNVTTILIGDSNKLSQDCAVNFEKWTGPFVDMSEITEHTTSKYDLMIDAVFGTGLNQPLSDELQAFFKLCATIPTVAVDIPSGVNGDTGQSWGRENKVDATVTFCCQKIGHVLYPGKALSGQVITADIGIESKYIQKNDSALLISKEDAVGIGQEPAYDMHKFSRGYVIVAGAEIMTGATRLATRAAQRIGAGYVLIASPEKASTLYRVSLSSAVVKGYRDTTGFNDIISDDRCNALLIGPGMGFAFGAQERVLSALKTKFPIVLDADALTLFEGHTDLLFDHLHDNVILTPHEGEFARLFPDLATDHALSKLQKVQAAQKRAQATILLKGSDTVIVSHDGQVALAGRNTGYLATAGSGDVLAGLIAGILSQGWSCYNARKAAIYLHTQLAKEFGPGLIAEDLIETIPLMLRNHLKK